MIPQPIPVPEVRFTDVTDAAGIRFRHVNGAFGKKLLPETMGSGVAVIDFDGDGKPDLLFVNSFRRVLPDAPVDFHAIQIVYTATVIGGELCHEVGGSTDMAAWHPIADVPALTRVQLVDMGLAAVS